MGTSSDKNTFLWPQQAITPKCNFKVLLRFSINVKSGSVSQDTSKYVAKI